MDSVTPLHRSVPRAVDLHGIDAAEATDGSIGVGLPTPSHSVAWEIGSTFTLAWLHQTAACGLKTSAATGALPWIAGLQERIGRLTVRSLRHRLPMPTRCDVECPMRDTRGGFDSRGCWRRTRQRRGGRIIRRVLLVLVSKCSTALSSAPWDLISIGMHL